MSETQYIEGPKSYPIQIDKRGNLCQARMDARSTRVVELSDYESLHAENEALRAKLAPVLMFLIEPESGRLWGEVEAMLDSFRIRGKAKFIRDLKALWKEYEAGL